MSLKYITTEVTFKLNDYNRKDEDQLEVLDDMRIIKIDLRSFHNGLIVGDKILKVNGIPAKDRSAIAPILAGKECKVEVSRFDSASVVPMARFHNYLGKVLGEHSYFVLTFTRPTHISAQSEIGVRLLPLHRKSVIVTVLPTSMLAKHVQQCDSFLDFDGVPLPFHVDAPYLREQMTKFQANGKLSILVERPISDAARKRKKQLLRTFSHIHEDHVDMAEDAKTIGMEASNMHMHVFRKLQPPSILSVDVAKVREKMTDKEKKAEKENKLKISAAVAETRISSDVEDLSDLKKVERKSHAVEDDDDE